MPIISLFYGIIIRLFYNDNQQHHVPYIHAEYQDETAVISLIDGEVLDGNIPKGKLRLVQAWVELHRDDLLANWKIAVEGGSIFKIEGLK